MNDNNVGVGSTPLRANKAPRSGSGEREHTQTHITHRAHQLCLQQQQQQQQQALQQLPPRLRRGGGVQEAYKGGRVQALHGCPALPASYLHLHLRRLHSAQAQCHHACASWRHACRLLCPSSKLRQQKIRHKEGELGHSKRQANGQLPDDLHVDVPSRREGGLLPRSGNAEKSSGPSGPPSPPH